MPPDAEALIRMFHMKRSGYAIRTAAYAGLLKSVTGVGLYIIEKNSFSGAIQSKKAPRPGAFLLPKPKPMRRITLLKLYNGGGVFRLHK